MSTNRLIDFGRAINAAPAVAFAFAVFFLASTAAGQTNYCNNPVPPCNPSDPTSKCYAPPDPCPRCEPKECGKCTKSPTYVGSGVYAFDAVDLSIATPGFPIDVSRSYQSTRAIDGEAGYGWVSSLSARLYSTVFLKAAPDVYEREAHVRLPNGSSYRFVENADGTFSGPPGRFDTLVRNSDGSWDLWLQQSRSRYRYSAAGNLVTAVDDFGNSQTWTYVADRLQRVSDDGGSGRYIDVTYGADGRISDVTDMTGRNIRYTYDSRGVLLGATNPAGQTTSYSYAPGKHAPLLTGVSDHWGRVVTTITYDAQDRATSYTDFGEAYVYTYAAGSTTKRDSLGNAWQFRFDADGLVTDSIPPGGGPTHRVTYDASGLVSTAIDPVGVQTLFAREVHGSLQRVVWDHGGTSTVEWRFTYDPDFPDRPASAVAYDPATNQIHPHWRGELITYHPLGSTAPGAIHRLSALDSDGVTARRMAEFTYNSRGLMTSETDGAGSLTEYRYDAAGNLESITAPANNDSGLRPVTTLTYDALGRVTSVKDPMGRVTSYTYDVLDRIVTRTLPKPTSGFPLDFRTTYTYDLWDAASGLLYVETRDANGVVTREGSDEFDRLIRAVDALANVTTYRYAGDVLSSVVDANGHVTSFEYDGRRRVSATVFPDATRETYVYRADDVLQAVTDRKGQTVTFAYDPLKRVTKKTYPDGTWVSYTYAGALLIAIEDTSASPDETHSFTYDGAFRLVRESQAQRGTINYTYDAIGALATTSVAGGPVTSYGYYPDGSLSTLTWSPVAGVFKYTYRLDGDHASIMMPSGHERRYSYDDQGRLTQVANVHQATGNLATVDYAYDVNQATGAHDRLGLRVSAVANIPALGFTNALTRYHYDRADQLTRADYPASAPFNGETHSWTYDGMGHRLTGTNNGATTTYSYQSIGTNPNAWQRLLSDGQINYTYDANGNTTTRGSTSYGWDFENRMVSAGSTAYAYDSSGRRTVKINGAVRTEYVYDGPNLVRESGADYLFGAGIDEPLALLRGGEVFYLGADGLGSVVTVADPAGAIQNAYAYDAWGAANSASQAAVQPFRFTGREAGDAFDDLFYRARYYSPQLGRFLSEDPLRIAEDANFYRYVRNRPTELTDPTGLRAYLCKRPLSALGGKGTRSGIDDSDNPKYHEYFCFGTSAKNMKCCGQGRGPREWKVRPFTYRRRGMPTDDKFRDDCVPTGPDSPCVDKCLQSACKEKRPDYALIGPHGTNCQEWAHDKVNKCQNRCGISPPSRRRRPAPWRMD